MNAMAPAFVSTPSEVARDFAEAFLQAQFPHHGGLTNAAPGQMYGRVSKMAFLPVGETLCAKSGWRKPAVANQRNCPGVTRTHGGLTPAALDCRANDWRRKYDFCDAQTHIEKERRVSARRDVGKHPCNDGAAKAREIATLCWRMPARCRRSASAWGSRQVTACPRQVAA